MLLIHAMFALALLAAQKQEPSKRSNLPPVSGAMKILCTPNSIAVGGGLPRVARYSIAAALSIAAPGAQIDLDPGDYCGFEIGFENAGDSNARTSGGTRLAPITVDGHGHARIRGKSDSLQISQQIKNGFITFQNIEFSAGPNSAVQFLHGDGWVHEGYRFLDCDIVGDWDHSTDSGVASSKWGLRGWGLKDFEFRGSRKRARIVKLRLEHALWLQDLRGDVLIADLDVARIGGAFLQITSDAGAPGKGLVTIRNCSAKDCGLAPGDTREGMGVFTFSGGHDGTIQLQGNTFRAGFFGTQRDSTRPKSLFGRGALIAWDGEDQPSTTRLILESNRFEMSEAWSERPLVAIGACASVMIRGENWFVAGPDATALELEPKRKSQPEGAPVGRLSIDRETVIKGAIRLRGTSVTLEELLSRFPRPVGY